MLSIGCQKLALKFKMNNLLLNKLMLQIVAHIMHMGFLHQGSKENIGLPKLSTGRFCVSLATQAPGR